jgi:hypothetical protein
LIVLDRRFPQAEALAFLSRIGYELVFAQRCNSSIRLHELLLHLTKKTRNFEQCPNELKIKMKKIKL